jgi:Membrane bound O-acyl transferase family
MSSHPTTLSGPDGAPRAHQWIGWLALPVLLAADFALRGRLRPWEFMWALAFAIYAGLKWLTWWRARGSFPHPKWRSVAYLLAWPGMGADSFLDESRQASPPSRGPWIWAMTKTASGATLLWILARSVPAHFPLLRGWTGMFGLIFLLHFGSFEIIALLWQSLGVDAQPIMNFPLRSTSLTEFWGKRWNLGFRQLSHDLIFRPAAKAWGSGAAGLLVFVVSGLVHDLVISVPARGGYGLPTAYFVLQGFGVALERSVWGRRAGVWRGLRGWMFMAAFTAGPLFCLFHPPFVLHVIIPFMKAIHAL